MENFVTLNNNGSISVDLIPVLSYEVFSEQVIKWSRLADRFHCINYYGVPEKDETIQFFICMADDIASTICVTSYKAKKNSTLNSLSKQMFALHIFEREIQENHLIHFNQLPWDKPVRYAFDRVDKSKVMNNYPFFAITGEDLHQVGVGPIHAGVIEPGHFRFICNGETVLHLEIQLGYQHRGVEKTFLEKSRLIQRTVLAESIAGDSVVGHTLPFVQIMETLYGFEPNLRLSLLRTIALELERIAIHVGDLSAICLDIAYQLGNAVFGALRTPIINFNQYWCGSRFSRGLIRVGYNPFPFNAEIEKKLRSVLNDFENKFMEIQETTFQSPSVMSRLERTGLVTKDQMKLIGAVGMPARITGLRRDIRTTHPTLYYTKLRYQPILLETGDVLAHAMMRNLEIQRSLSFLGRALDALASLPENEPNTRPAYKEKQLAPNQFCISMVEGWRGEIAHSAITNEKGEIVHYKVKDPSIHNWFALALAVRNQEISDFPICNKSYDQSYCGFDL